MRKTKFCVGLSFVGICYLLRISQGILITLCLLSPYRTAGASSSTEYLASFDPAKGFKPAQRDLTEIFLQIAGSLEAYGSPVPYMQHMVHEHERIEALYRTSYGKEPQSLRPDYMTDDYLALFAKNWDFLAPKLGLKSLTMDIGREMRAGITGTQGEAVTIVTIFQAHQKSVLESMAGNSDGQAEFDTLKSKIMIQFDQAQTDDSDPSTPETKQPLAAIRRRISTLFGALDNGLSPADASKVKTALTSMFTDVGRMAQSELEASNVEWALRQEASPTVVDAARPYNADQETALNAKEREKFAALLSKPRFTQADFEQLDAFYAGPYDKLSARGKDELSYRVWGGMRAQKSD